MRDVLVIGGFSIGVTLLVIAFVSWILHYFVALGSPPAKRAAWTSGIAYLVAAVFCAFAAPSDYWWAAPLAPVPAALIAFWWWRNDFRRDWIGDSHGAPEGVELATDDWRIGLLQLLGAITLALGVAVLRHVFRHL